MRDVAQYALIWLAVISSGAVTVNLRKNEGSSVDLVNLGRNEIW